MYCYLVNPWRFFLKGSKPWKFMCQGAKLPGGCLLCQALAFVCISVVCMCVCVCSCICSHRHEWIVGLLSSLYQNCYLKIILAKFILLNKNAQGPRFINFSKAPMMQFYFFLFNKVIEVLEDKFNFLTAINDRARTWSQKLHSKILTWIRYKTLKEAKCEAQK